VISRSGTLTYEIVDELTRAGIGQSTVVGIGGDPVIGQTFVDLLRRFEEDPETKAVVLVGEVGGALEQEGVHRPADRRLHRRGIGPAGQADGACRRHRRGWRRGCQVQDPAPAGAGGDRCPEAIRDSWPHPGHAMKTELMLRKGIELAEAIHAEGVIAFLPRTPYTSSVEVFWADEGYLELEKDLSEGTLVGVFPHAILVYSIEEAAGMIDLESFGQIVPMPVMKAALTLAMEIGAEGREGRAVGTAFIIGDGDLILANSHQLILNPYWGHPREITSILNHENWESVKEFAQLDGIFAIDRDGSVLAAGRYMDVDSRSVTLPGGLGGRHRAVAAITRLIPVAGIIISESGGIVRLYRDGVCRLTLRSDVSMHP